MYMVVSARMKCDFIHVEDPAALVQSREWRVGAGGPFDTEAECRRARIKLADQLEPASEKRRDSFWCIPYARDAVPSEFAKSLTQKFEGAAPDGMI
jgi:hypothetical protein